MRTALLGSLLLATLGATAAAQPLSDHLQCHRITDPFDIRGTVDVTTRFGTVPGCRLRRAALLCTPAQSTVTAGGPAVPVAGRGLLDARICYRLKCDRPFPSPPPTVSDEFGTHTFRRLLPKLVCTPAVLGAPMPLQDSLDHLECYRARDFTGRQATVTTNAQPNGVTTGCHLSRTRLFCTSATTGNVHVNVSPELDLDAGSARDNDRVCYRLNCRVPKTYALVSDRFGSRTMAGVSPTLLCSPAPPTTVPTTTTTTRTTTTTTLPASTEETLVCQRTIESRGMTYANQLMSEIEGCAAPGQSDPLDTCLGSAPVQSRLATAENEWDADMTAECVGVNLRHDLGYLESCPAPCQGASATVAGVRQCLACHIRRTLTDAARSLYANQPVGMSACRGALGDGGLGELRGTLQQLDVCTQQPGATSVAACFAPALAAWRSQAESTCAGIDPFGSLGYSTSCSGLQPVAPAFCGAEARPCTFPDATALTGPGANLLDCLECRTEEAVLTVARTLHGANLCCIGGVCNQVLTRFACRQAEGTPVRYRVNAFNFDSSTSGPHGIAWGLDGNFYIADGGGMLKVTPGGTVTSTNVGGFATGVAADAAGNVYVTLRCNHTITKITPGGAVSTFAGTYRTPGSSGDEGPASAALITSPDGITIDPSGNIYFTESRALSFACPVRGPVGTERIRRIDAAGTIHAFAGTSTYGSGGAGGPQLAAQFGLPYGLRWAAGSLFVGEAGIERVLRIAGGTVTHLAGRPGAPIGVHSGYGGPAVRARFYENCGVAQDADGNVIVSPMTDNRIALIDSLGSVITIAGNGNGSVGPAGDGNLALLAPAGCPEDVDVGPDGRIYFSDLQVGRIRVLTRESF